VEFIVDDAGHHYFMEMNTRLQVEHPVTELVTGQDLVEWQLRVACGEPLPEGQDELALRGHAIEARLYAEDPDRGFLPATGRLAELRFPAEDEHLRVDTGVQAGDEVTIHYDPLLAKLIVWGRDRSAALRRLKALLRDTRVTGVRTNLEFLAMVAGHEAFARGAVDTGFIDRHRDELLGGSAGAAPPPVGTLATDIHVLRELGAPRRTALAPLAPHTRQEASHTSTSPWEDKSGWRLGSSPIASGAQPVAGPRMAPLPAAEIDRGTVGSLTAPMPGRVVAVHVAEGQAVRRGEALLVLEAMKMEHAVTAPGDGVVREIRFAAGDLVEEGAELLVLG
jgi:3-methylcrotonyl-CoA carboxylase alpha subunit